MSLRALLFSLLLPLPLKAESEWTATEKQGKQTLANCSTSYYARFEVAGPTQTSFSLLVLSPKEISFDLVDQPERSLATTVKELAKKHKAIAAINGGYFTLDYEPLGLFKTPQTQLGQLEKSSLLGGLFVIEKGSPRIVWRRDFTGGTPFSHILQTGPRLVDGGKAVLGLESQKRRPRTFIAQTQDGKWILGNCQKLSLAELAEVLSKPKLFHQMAIVRALNFDGGRSAALWCKLSNEQEPSLEEVVHVRNVLIAKPKHP